jgi:hypothetical protein
MGPSLRRFLSTGPAGFYSKYMLLGDLFLSHPAPIDDRLMALSDVNPALHCRLDEFSNDHTYSSVILQETRPMKSIGAISVYPLVNGSGCEAS